MNLNTLLTSTKQSTAGVSQRVLQRFLSTSSAADVAMACPAVAAVEESQDFILSHHNDDSSFPGDLLPAT